MTMPAPLCDSCETADGEHWYCIGTDNPDCGRYRRQDGDEPHEITEPPDA